MPRQPLLNETQLPTASCIYLAGGMRTGWQDTIKATLADLGHPIIWLDPRASGLTDPAAYTAWDLTAVAKADLVFAFLETENPGGAGLAMECGFAAARNIPYILVDPQERPDSRYYAMCRSASLGNPRTLEEGIAALKSWLAWRSE